jgi:hypothetical protein
MPVTQTYQINALDLGQAERNRLQAQTIVALLSGTTRRLKTCVRS